MAERGFGLSALMEAVNHAEQKKYANTILMEAMDDGIDDDLRVMVAGPEYGFVPEDDDEGEIESAMAGLGITAEDEELYEKLLAHIPEDGEGMEDRIKEVTESFFMNLPNLVGVM